MNYLNPEQLEAEMIKVIPNIVEALTRFDGQCVYALIIGYSDKTGHLATTTITSIPDPILLRQLLLTASNPGDDFSQPFKMA